MIINRGIYEQEENVKSYAKGFKEVKQLRMEKEILKKANAFFASEIK